jgi:hypothetical protein
LTARFATLLACLALVPAGSAAAQTADTLYGSDGAGGNDGDLVTLDRATGAVIQTIGPVGFSITGLAIDPSNGTMYGSTGVETSDSELVTINKQTGAGTLVGQLNDDDDPAADITFRGGTLFGWLQGPDDLATIDRSTGTATVVGDSGLDTRGSGLAAAPDGTLYFTGSNDNGPLHTIDPATGSATVAATLDGTCGTRINALAFDSTGTLYGVRRSGGLCNATQLIRINTTTGHVEAVGDTLRDLDAIVFEPVAAEPAPNPTPTPTQTETPTPTAECMNSRGGLSGRRLGPVRLGRRRAEQREMMHGDRRPTRGGMDKYCAAGGGLFRIGYPKDNLLRVVSPALRRAVSDRVVLALTSSPRFTLSGVVPYRTSESDARRRLRGEERFRVGRNTWYVTGADGPVLRLVKARGGLVREIGIADARLADGGRRQLRRFLTAWDVHRP